MFKQQIFPVLLVENNSDLIESPFDFDPNETNPLYQQDKGRCFSCGDPVVSQRSLIQIPLFLDPYQWVPQENHIWHKKCKEAKDQENKIETEITLFTEAIQELQTMIEKKIEPTAVMIKSMCLAMTCENLIREVTQKPVGTGNLKQGLKRCAAKPMGCGFERDLKDFALLCAQKLPLEIQNSRSYSCLCTHCLGHQNPQKKYPNLLLQNLIKAVSKTGNEFQIDMAIDNVKRKSGTTSKIILQQPEMKHESGPKQWFHQAGRCVLCSLPLAAWAKCNDCWTPPVWVAVNGYWSWVHESCLDKEGTKQSLLLQQKGREFLHALHELYDLCEKNEAQLNRGSKPNPSLVKATSVFLSVVVPQAKRLSGWTQSQKRTQKLDEASKKSILHLFNLCERTEKELEVLYEEGLDEDEDEDEEEEDGGDEEDELEDDTKGGSAEEEEEEEELEDDKTNGFAQQEVLNKDHQLPATKDDHFDEYGFDDSVNDNYAFDEYGFDGEEDEAEDLKKRSPSRSRSRYGN